MRLGGWRNITGDGGLDGVWIGLPAGAGGMTARIQGMAWIHAVASVPSSATRGSSQFWISRPSTRPKWRTLPVTSIKDRLRAIAAIRRSGSSSGVPSDSSEARKDP